MNETHVAGLATMASRSGRKKTMDRLETSRRSDDHPGFTELGK
jgi:hypothetical protein